MIEAFGVTDPGCVRSNNEDYFVVEPPLGLYLVADGMGGAQAGEHASRMAAETVRQVLEETSRPVTAEALAHAFSTANERVATAAQSDPDLDGMGTTLVAAIESGEELLIASVGDSRVYLFDEGQIEAITDDQTWVNEVGRRLGLDEPTLKTHPMRHVLTMAIGVSDQLRIHTYRLRPKTGSVVLLCSDGLHGVVADEDIAQALSANGSTEQIGHRLIASARDRGAPDNVTVVVLQFK